MERRVVGSSGLRVSRLGLGTMTWGRETGADDARAQLVAFLDAGGTLVDTAHPYAEGRSEELIGALIGDVVAREDVVLATKAGVFGPYGQRFRDTSRRAILRSLDESLARLNTDHVDLLMVHQWSDDTPVDETLDALQRAVSSGRARYIGVSNYDGWQSALAATLAKENPAHVPLVSNQVEYSLLNRGVEREIVPAARALGLGLFAWSPLGRGVLTAKYRDGIPRESRVGEGGRAAPAEVYLDDDRSLRVVDAVLKAAEGLGWTPAQVALAWVRDRPGVVAPILGARRVAQLRESLSVESLTLPHELVAALDDVSA